MRRILILSNQSLFWCGVQKLLSPEAGCVLVGWERDLDQALERIRELRPDAVLLDKGDVSANGASPVMRILEQGLETRVIALSLMDSSISVYRQERHQVDNVNDLVHIIEQAEASTG